ncbi:glutaminyl-peptide cyclotransferase [Rhodococcus sp. NPDC058532]|uniref:glutaminyl-peptide cyclotransferase n=1 Tax=Rhodococcus sp. NPDC058532 TaxID=3346540 RepID=UPI003655DD80
MTRFRLLGLAVAATVLTLGSCAAGSSDDPGSSGLGSSGSVPTLRVDVLDRRPHDPTAFTQGLEIADGALLEGTGLVGRSYVTARDLDTGAELARADLPATMFGEGITVVGDTVWQLTWRDQVAFARDRTTLRERARVAYDGEGWGLCAQPDRLVMSDGSSTLTFRDPATFAVRGTVDVTLDDRRVDRLNELECTADGMVYANVWQTTDIVRIDPASGAVVAVIDASGLLTEADAAEADVLNGIAAIPGTDRFLITGKLYPTIFDVRFVS